MCEGVCEYTCFRTRGRAHRPRLFFEILEYSSLPGCWIRSRGALFLFLSLSLSRVVPERERKHPHALVFRVASRVRARVPVTRTYRRNTSPSCARTPTSGRAASFLRRLRPTTRERLSKRRKEAYTRLAQTSLRGDCRPRAPPRTPDEFRWISVGIPLKFRSGRGRAVRGREHRADLPLQTPRGRPRYAAPLSADARARERSLKIAGFECRHGESFRFVRTYAKSLCTESFRTFCRDQRRPSPRVRLSKTILKKGKKKASQVRRHGGRASRRSRPARVFFFNFFYQDEKLCTRTSTLRRPPRVRDSPRRPGSHTRTTLGATRSGARSAGPRPTRQYCKSVELEHR